jgi:aspartyl-tRNA(Asn)/glutamyl-tRNA(Gln) amidotransferase subunit C
MHLTDDNIRIIARLARLQIDEKNIPKVRDRLSGILNWVEQLKPVDTTGVEPMESIMIDVMPMRKDEVTDGGISEKVLANAPAVQEDMFVVPKVVE